MSSKDHKNFYLYCVIYIGIRSFKEMHVNCTTPQQNTIRRKSIIVRLYILKQH